MNKMLTEIAGKAWAAPMTAVGIIAGTFLSGVSLLKRRGARISLENNAITFTTGLKLHGSITFGNSIIHAGGNIHTWNAQSMVSRYNRAAVVNLGKHEEAHTYQYQRYGIFTIPLLVCSAVANGGLKAPDFCGFMACSAFETAADDYAQWGPAGGATAAPRRRRGGVL
jgi:hypothetical protein